MICLCQITGGYQWLDCMKQRVVQCVFSNKVHSVSELLLSNSDVLVTLAYTILFAVSLSTQSTVFNNASESTDSEEIS